MSSLATIGQLRRAASQLPVSWYCDPVTFQAEQRHLFARAPGYAGHELMVPNAGDYCALATRDNAQALVRNNEGIELISNICRHRQAIMLQGRGNTANIVCPIHRWTYDLRGELLGAPHFDDKPCLNLGRSPLQNWKGLLFDGKRDVARDLADMGVRRSISPATCSIASTSTNASTTGSRSSRSTSRTTTSVRSIPGLASSSPATT